LIKIFFLFRKLCLLPETSIPPNSFPPPPPTLHFIIISFLILVSPLLSSDRVLIAIAYDPFHPGTPSFPPIIAYPSFPTDGLKLRFSWIFFFPRSRDNLDSSSPVRFSLYPLTPEILHSYPKNSDSIAVPTVSNFIVLVSSFLNRYLPRPISLPSAVSYDICLFLF